MIDLNLEHMPQPPRKKDYRIGVIGAGFIVRDVHLVAYERAGFDVRAIACADPAQAREVALARRIPTAYDTVEELLNDESLEVLDIAVPPGEQLGVMKQVIRHAGHVRGVLAQKPLSLDYARAREIVEMCEGAGIVLAVNQNMRYDQSIRACKTLLARGDLGEPVLGTIEMRALTDPRADFPHRDGIPPYILEYASGLRAATGILGIGELELLRYPDRGLAAQ